MRKNIILHGRKFPIGGNPRKKFQSDSLILIYEEIILVIPNFFHDFYK